MNHKSGPTRRGLLAGGAALAVAAPALAQAPWPNRTVRVIVTYPPGGGADTVSRILFAQMSERLGQQFVIENRAGGGGTIGAQAAARSTPDGYTLMHDATAFSVNPALFPKLPYDSEKDFEPVFLACVVPSLLVVTPSSPVKTVADIVALAKKTAGGLDWGSAGNGSAQHLALALLARTAGIQLNHVPYRGGGPAMNDVIGGQVNFIFANASGAIGHVRGGSVRAIAHTGTGRMAALPDVPAVAETLPGYECLEWNGVFAPAGTPAEIVAKLNAELNATIAVPAVAERLAGLGASVRPNSAAEFRQFVADATAKWGKVVRDADIRID
jgi:tripartite-type tricarboxylate transporter receptor subunit TctC